MRVALEIGKIGHGSRKGGGDMCMMKGIWHAALFAANAANSECIGGRNPTPLLSLLQQHEPPIPTLPHYLIFPGEKNIHREKQDIFTPFFYCTHTNNISRPCLSPQKTSRNISFIPQLDSDLSLGPENLETRRYIFLSPLFCGKKAQ